MRRQLRIGVKLKYLPLFTTFQGQNVADEKGNIKSSVAMLLLADTERTPL